MERKLIFNENYQKFCGQQKARLLNVIPLEHPRQTMPEFIDYETRIDQCATKIIADGVYLHLTLLGIKGIPFTIMVAHTPAMEAFYKDNIGQMFDIVIDEQKAEFGRGRYAGTEAKKEA